ncbi:MAG: thiamine pyrophosphate-binding protein [Helicobacteraceae bacterium]|jgi:acetolactate synthase-1/2/3 large subunit|nr:thiamine pyrophosphate-binding protein [Helicobacteraceae bacterium]
MLVADYIVEYLARKGVKRAYGYPGSLAGFIMDALRKRSAQISNRLLYTEQACGFAAIGDSLVSGNPTLCWAISGPGATNLVTPIANAWLDSVPVIFLTANVHTADSREAIGCAALRQNGNQELDTVSIVAPITKFAARIDDPTKIREILDQAWESATSGRKAPVLIDLPINISRSETKADFAPIAPKIRKHSQALQTIEEAIAAAKAPLIIAGAGIRQAGVSTAFCAWLAKWTRRYPSLKVVVSLSAKDLAARTRSVGVLGVWGVEAANEAVKNADTVIAIGDRLSNRQLAAFGGALSCKVIRADIDEAEFSRKVTSGETIDLFCDLADLFEPSAAETPKRVFVSDVGQNMWRAARELATQEGDRVLFSAGLGAMGFSLPAAIGAYYAAPDAEVIALCGDGGLQMSSEELHFIAQHRPPITVIVFNNGALGLIRAFQERNFSGEFFSTTANTGYLSPDWEALAKAYGVNYYRFDSGGGGGSELCAITDLASRLRKTSYLPLIIEAKVEPVYP